MPICGAIAKNTLCHIDLHIDAFVMNVGSIPMINGPIFIIRLYLIVSLVNLFNYNVEHQPLKHGYIH